MFVVPHKQNSIEHFCISRHYRQAYGLLGELKTSDINMLEIKVVAGFINYKVCYHTREVHILSFRQLKTQ